MRNLSFFALLCLLGCAAVELKAPNDGVLLVESDGGGRYLVNDGVPVSFLTIKNFAETDSNGVSLIRIRIPNSANMEYLLSKCDDVMTTRVPVDMYFMNGSERREVKCK